MILLSFKEKKLITSKKKIGDKVVLTVHEDILDLKSGEEFKTALTDLYLKNEKEIVLDLGKIQLINSHGIGKILMFYKKFKDEGGQIYVAGLKGTIREIFESLLLLNIIPEIELEIEPDKS